MAKLPVPSPSVLTPGGKEERRKGQESWGRAVLWGLHDPDKEKTAHVRDSCIWGLPSHQAVIEWVASLTDRSGWRQKERRDLDSQLTARPQAWEAPGCCSPGWRLTRGRRGGRREHWLRGFALSCQAGRVPNPPHLEHRGYVSCGQGPTSRDWPVQGGHGVVDMATQPTQVRIITGV